VTVFALAGELDLSSTRKMEAPLLEQLRQRSAVLVDLTEVSFIDSSGIGVLIEAARESNGTPMQVVMGSGSQVERIFTVAKVGDALPVHLDRTHALTAISERRRDGSPQTRD
jgi:anti-sigma B factor antagonist